MTPFKVVYGVDPLSSLDLVPRSSEEKPSVEANKIVEEIQKLHKQVMTKIEKFNTSYQAQANKHQKKAVFQPCGLVWIHLRKERFPSKCKSKLMPKVNDPFKVLERVNDNPYKVNLPRDYSVLTPFNVVDLSPYLEDDHLVNLGANSSQQREDD